MAPAPTPLRHRTTTALAGAALVGAALLVGGGTATAAPAAPASSLVGTWSATVDRGTATNSSTLVFSASGKLCLRTDSSTGTGSYVSRGDYLAYRADERSAEGTVKINQVGRRTGTRFVSQGISVIYDTSGRRVGQTAVTVTATRTSTSTAGC